MRLASQSIFPASLTAALLIGACAGDLPSGDGRPPVTSNEAGGELGAWDGGTTSGDLFVCSLAADGYSCGDGDVCSWSHGCDAGRCECENGALVCIATSTCDDGGTADDGGTPGSCPAPQEARCGMACTGDLRDCLCRSGGPNYTQCDCVGGFWSC